MINANQYLHHSRTQTRLAVLPLLVLLLVFLSSISLHQASASRIDHGFITTLDNMAIASHNEALRALGNNCKTHLSEEDNKDLSKWWPDNPTALWAELSRQTCINTLVEVSAPTATDFLSPLRRAPPLV